MFRSLAARFRFDRAAGRYRAHAFPRQTPDFLLLIEFPWPRHGFRYNVSVSARKEATCLAP